MDKSIKVEIAVGIVLIIAVTIGGFVWLGSKQQKQMQTAAQSARDKAVLSTPKASDGDNSASPTADVMMPTQYDERTPSIGGFRINLPEDWVISSQTEENMNNVFTLKGKPETALVLKVSKNNADNIKAFKDERTGTEYTKIESGEIFKFTGCGVSGNSICNGAIVDGDVYSFAWSVNNNKPILENQNLPEPPQSFSEGAIWNVIKTIEAK